MRAVLVLLEHLSGFLAALRSRGVPISSREWIDLGQALSLLQEESLNDLETWRAVLSCCLLKSEAFRAVFEQTFEAHFCLAQWMSPVTQRPLSSELVRRGIARERTEELALSLKCVTDDAAAMLLEGDFSRLGLRCWLQLRTLEGEVRLYRAQPGYGVQRVWDDVGLPDAYQLWRWLPADFAEQLADAEQRALLGLWQERTAAAQRMVRRLVHETLSPPKGGVAGAEQALAELNWEHLSEAQANQLIQVAQRLARRMMFRAKRQSTSRKKGALDFRRTIRRGLTTRGVPFTLIRRRTEKRHRRLVVVCDVSDSVRRTSQIFLPFLAALRHQSASLEVYAFVDHLVEVQAVPTHPSSGMIVESWNAVGLELSGASDYGQMCLELEQKLTSARRGAVSLLILGDGRNNRRPANVTTLARICRRARTVTWLCPEPKDEWGAQDSVMDRYRCVVPSIRVVQNLRELAGAVEQVLR